MPTQKIVTLFQYDELPTEEAKEAARNWFREGDDLFSEMVSYDDFISICEAMGVEVGTETERYGNGKTRQVPAIYWSGFWSQGDGACFTGTFKLDGTAGEKIRAYASQDDKLHRIADAFDSLNAICPGLAGTIARPYGTQYSHQHTMYIDLDEEVSENPKFDIQKVENDAQDLCRDLAGWLYKYLEAEWEYQNANEQVIENIRANEYTFTEDGKRED